jgi:hypothetical protein
VLLVNRFVQRDSLRDNFRPGEGHRGLLLRPGHGRFVWPLCPDGFQALANGRHEKVGRVCSHGPVHCGGIPNILGGRVQARCPGVHRGNDLAIGILVSKQLHCRLVRLAILL